jgi:hypothetical protein
MTDSNSHDEATDEDATKERTTDAPPPGTPRPDPEQISEGLSDYGVVSAGGHVGPEKGDQAAGDTEP